MAVFTDQSTVSKIISQNYLHMKFLERTKFVW